MDTDDFSKDIKDIKKSIKIEPGHRSTIVHVAAVSFQEKKNKLMFIPCHAGTPITQDAYDAVRDGFLFFGYDSIELGVIPVSYSLDFEGASWGAEIPLPMSVIKKYLSKEEKVRFEEWKLTCGDCYFESLQILESYTNE